MKIFFYMGRNPRTRSGVSWKIWKVARHGRIVATHWGPAKVYGRKVVPDGYVRSKVHKFKTPPEAMAYERRAIKSKLNKGYQRRTRWR